ncbi:2,3-dihydroxybenzoate-AMP ligase [Altericroceibacterium spongiae]|uniref:2,3-dihydroxybenzoate-AMP ligase n=1 Tax=Altericroceibacterium spongiae TaxID=2320269 RepID=A0A420EA98_9SPHN|nr:AMP-binding protein [Altericroceibacterium spongiae]RKF17595.1 2,3-dihydroxybenzoate-AMP ligase [Altericroceibacterium spongiae]
MIPLEQPFPEEFARRYRERGYWRGDTFPEVLERQAADRRDALVVIGGDERWTYGELAERAETMAAGFLKLGLKPGDRVVVQLPNIPAFFAVTFGLFRAGLIPVFTLPAHRLTEIIHFVRKSEASALVIADEFDGFDYRPLAAAVKEAVPALAHVVVIGEAGEHKAASDFSADPSCLPAIYPDPSSVALVQISGGSTGLSKLIPRTHDDYLYSIWASNDLCGITPDSVYLAALPVAHNFPMSSPGVFGAIYAGATIVMAPKPDPRTAFPLIEQEKVTITGLVPPLALLWLQSAPKLGYDLSSLEVLQVGGAKFMPEAAKKVRPVLGCTLQQVFGMAEGLVNYTRLDDPEEIIVNTQGRPISPDDEVLVLDDQGQPVPDGMPGNLLARGPYTIRAYHDDPGANARSFTEDGFYRTGDVVKRMAGGYVEVLGRATDHINRAGEKISAEEVEDHLLAHPAIFDAAVVSMPDRFLGERSCAFIIPDGDAPSAAALKAWMRDREIAAFKIPDQVVMVDSFATTAVGKISRKELRAALREQQLEKEGTRI